MDLRKDLGTKNEALAVLEAESKICIVDDELLKIHGVTPKARVCMPGVTDADLAKSDVAANTQDQRLETDTMHT